MKVIIYSASTINGLIAKKDESDYSFISDKAWEFYLKTLKEVGAFIMGRRTYEVSLRTGVFPYDCLNVVMTHKHFSNHWGDKVIFTDQNPRELLKFLEKKGLTNVIVTGGHLSASFMEQKLVDEVWIDLMPRIFTNGINLFEGEDFEAELKLFNVQKFSEDIIQLRYSVAKYF